MVIDRRIEAPIPGRNTAACGPIQSGVITFRNANSEDEQSFYPDRLGLPWDLVEPLMKAFRSNDAGLTPSTRAARWRAIRRFAIFLNEEGIGSAKQINAGVIRRYFAFLAKPSQSKRLGRVSINTQISLVRPLLKNVEQSYPDLFGPSLAIPYNPIPNARYTSPRKRISKEDLLVLLQYCYEEIDESWGKFNYGRSVINGSTAPEYLQRSESLESAIWRCHEATQGVAPTWEQIRKVGLAESRLQEWGWQSGFAEYFNLTSQTVVPFYLALAIQLAANPDPLRLIRRDCLVEHPIDVNQVQVQWLKNKTAPNPSIQRRSFDVRRPRSAPKLIEMLLAMTAPLLPHIPQEDRDRLFVVYSFKTACKRQRVEVAGLVKYAILSKRIKYFIAGANERIANWNRDNPNRQKRFLPNFTPAQLRGSVAAQHYVASGGDLAKTAAILNHRDPVTTSTYVEGPAARKLERETIACLQRMMVSWVTGPSDPPPEERTGSIHGATSLFGHHCMRPIGVGDVDSKNVCRHLAGCLTCPGLVVPVDADHCARILQAARHLKQARDTIDPERWKLFYAPSLRVLEQDLLPAFSAEDFENAELIIGVLPVLPDIE